MSFLYKIPAIIYKSYDEKGIDIPHFRAIMTIVMILFLHSVHIGLIFNISSDYIMPWNSENDKQNQWMYGAIYFGCVIGIMAIVFRKSKLDKINLTQSQISRGGKIVPIYLFLSLTLMVVLLIKSGIEKGKINF